MKALSKSLLAMGIVSATIACLPAHAFTISFGGANAYQDDIDTPASDSIAAGKTSAVGGYIDANTNTVLSPNVFLETFDTLATGNNSFGFPTRPQAGNENNGKVVFGGTGSGPNGGFDTVNSNDGGDLSISGTMGIRSGSLSGVAAAPGGPSQGVTCTQPPCNNTYFAYGPGQGGPLPSSVKVDYSNTLAAYGPGYGIDYLGIFYGSIDTYNEIWFYDASDSLLSGAGLLADGILTGTEILNELGGTSGNQTSENSNVYVNLFFAPGEQFQAFEFRTTGIAFEIDNIVTHIGRGQQVPTPAIAWLFGSVLIGWLGMGFRRKKKAA